MAKIQPVAFPIIGTATELEVIVNSFLMDAKTADFYYRLTDSGDLANLKPKKLITEGTLSMNESEFAQWGADNNYCIEWVANKLGLTLI